MSRVRATTRNLAGLLTVLIVLIGVAPVEAARSAVLRWAPCADDRTTQCTVLRVPVDWADAYGPKVDIAVARRAATGPGPRIGTLVVNPGGPGGSGVDFTIGADFFFSKQIRERFDVVGFDPRGVARSSPVRCSAAVLDAGPSPLLASAADYRAATAYNRKLAADCRKQTGPVFAHVDSLSVARDLEALRVALGEEKISFYGASYGSLLGEQYAQRYPGRVRALVLDSVMDHSIGTGEFLTSETATAQDAFDEFVAWCARDTTCVLRGRDIKALWARLLARAAAGTLPDPYDPSSKLSVHDLLGVAFTSFYDPQFYSLAYFIKEATESAPAARGRIAAPLIENSFPAIFCTDWALPLQGYADFAGRLATLKASAPQMLASPLALSATVGCLGWPVPVRNPQKPLTRTTIPTLLINARHDPATPYAWAQNVAAQLGDKATLVTYSGWGHVVYGRTDCVTSIVDRYLLSLASPAAGTTCAGVVPDPFGVGKRRAPVVRRGPYR
jgi:pimeloyl-ACP methyl ester carboxylesterase